MNYHPTAYKKMQPGHSIIQKIYSLSPNTASCSRRACFVGICVCLIFYYLAPYFFRQVFSGFSYKSAVHLCTTRHLAPHYLSAIEFDASINHLPINEKDGEVPQLPFVGNGKLASLVKYEQEDSGLYLFYDTLFTNENKKEEKEHKLLRLPYDPLLRPEHVTGSHHKEEVSVVNFRNGIVEHLSCYSSSHGPLFLNHTVIAHRSRPNVLLQRLEGRIDGKSGSEDVYIHQQTINHNSVFKLLATNKAHNKQYKIYGGTVEVGHLGKMAVVFSITDTPDTLRATTDVTTLDSITVVMHSTPTKEPSPDVMSNLVKKLTPYTEEILGISTEQLLVEHKEAWADILHTGLTISTATDLDPLIPEPRIINATLYYVLSTMDSKLHDKDIPQDERRDLMKRLQTPDYCYNGNPTVHADRLWRNLKNVEDVENLAKHWTLTLGKHGCKHLISEGAEGVLQAMVISFGGLQFTDFDLQLRIDPDIMHNEITFKSLLYKNNSINVAIRAAEDLSTPVIEVSMRDHSKLPLYACEGGCLNLIQQLHQQSRRFPIFVTEPSTPILYISHDKKHLADMKHTLHLKSIVNYNEHMSIKRKGTGLPLVFWLGIGSLIIFFHMFLIRLICKEYYNPTVLPTTNKTYYSNRGRLAS
nr:uncharacterized protein KIAA2013 homolog [Ciona intestinalis]|eukprot:XP_002121205.3 uncharacterized protein KIAA2013 homolog [Ciona intestinalis]